MIRVCVHSIDIYTICTMLFLCLNAFNAFNQNHCYCLHLPLCPFVWVWSYARTEEVSQINRIPFQFSCVCVYCDIYCYYLLFAAFQSHRHCTATIQYRHWPAYNYPLPHPRIWIRTILSSLWIIHDTFYYSNERKRIDVFLASYSYVVMKCLNWFFHHHGWLRDFFLICTTNTDSFGNSMHIYCFIRVECVYIRSCTHVQRWKFSFAFYPFLYYYLIIIRFHFIHSLCLTLNQ